MVADPARIVITALAVCFALHMGNAIIAGLVARSMGAAS